MKESSKDKKKRLEAKLWEKIYNLVADVKKKFRNIIRTYETIWTPYWTPFFNSYANLLILLSSLLLMIYHGKLGMNTIIEDYISQKNLRKKILFANEYLSYILMFISIASIILLYF